MKCTCFPVVHNFYLIYPQTREAINEILICCAAWVIAPGWASKQKGPLSQEWVYYTTFDVSEQHQNIEAKQERLTKDQKAECQLTLPDMI